MNYQNELKFLLSRNEYSKTNLKYDENYPSYQCPCSKLSAIGYHPDLTKSCNNCGIFYCYTCSKDISKCGKCGKTTMLTNLILQTQM